MSASVPENPTTYRKEVLSKFFSYIQGVESFYLIGAASMGKTRLLDFLTLPETKTYYIRDPKESQRTLLIRVDLNRQIPGGDPIFNFFELMFSSLLFEFSKELTEETLPLTAELLDLMSKIIQGRDPLLAIRFLEMEITKLCQVYGYKLCFLFDEFDPSLHTAPKEIFALLRAIRDANKLNVCYALFLRNPPEKPEIRKEIESFYELISRNMVGIGPYNHEDTLGIVRKLGERRRFREIPPNMQEWLADTSGGHAGLIQALLSILADVPEATKQLNDLDWFARREPVREECRKILEGLDAEEQSGLKLAANGAPIEKITAANILYAKGLLKPGSTTCFSPMLERYLQA